MQALGWWSTHPMEAELSAIIANDFAAGGGEGIEAAVFSFSRLIGNGQVSSTSQNAGDPVDSDTDRSS